jgi:phospholipid/cholesterol/gamma-HCH transport system ATP-binding protein
VVLGPSGTGKSVLLQHLTGLMRPDAGEVLVRDRALSAMSDTELLDLNREIGVMFQDGALFSALNVFDNVAFPLRQHTDLTEREISDTVFEQLRAVGLADAAQRMPNELSGGMRKRAGLARALVLAPAIVLCDEPDSGLDPVRTALLAELLVQQHAEQGGTMVVVTHNVALARLISDHVSLVWRGRVVEAGMSEQVFASQTPFVRQFLDGLTDGPLGMDA